MSTTLQTGGFGYSGSWILGSGNYYYAYSFDAMWGSDCSGEWSLGENEGGTISGSISVGNPGTISKVKFRMVFGSQPAAGGQTEDPNNPGMYHWLGASYALTVNGTVRYRRNEGGWSADMPVGDSGQPEIVVDLGALAANSTVTWSWAAENDAAYGEYNGQWDCYLDATILEVTYSAGHSITLSHTAPTTGNSKLIYNGQFNSSTGALPGLTTVSQSFAYPIDGSNGYWFVESYT